MVKATAPIKAKSMGGLREYALFRWFKVLGSFEKKASAHLKSAMAWFFRTFLLSFFLKFESVRRFK